MNRYWELDIARFIAAFAVVTLHYFFRGFAVDDFRSPFFFPEIGQLVKYNHFGVHFFFMVSGFVIMLSVNRGRSVTGFLRGRVLRLFPAYLVACTLTFFVVTNFAPDLARLSWPRYLLNLTMLNGFFGIGFIDGVYWTLWVELKFYLCIALLIAWQKIDGIELWLFGWLAIAGVNLYLESEILIYLFSPEFASYFSAGCLFYFVKRDGYSLKRLLLLALTFMLSLAYGMNELEWREQRHPGIVYDWRVLLAIIAMLYLFFALLGRWRQGAPWPKLVAWMGGVSYPLYLLHNNLGMVAFRQLNGLAEPIYVVISVILLMLLLSTFFYLVVEPYMKRVVRYFLDALAVYYPAIRARFNRIALMRNG